MVVAGGPVHTERGFILHKNTLNAFQHTYKVTKELSMTTSADVVETLGSTFAPEKYLVALGCSSWGGWSVRKKKSEIMRGWWCHLTIKFYLICPMKIVMLQPISYLVFILIILR